MNESTNPAGKPLGDVERAVERWEQLKYKPGPVRLKRHITHYSDCGCASDAADAAITELKAALEQAEAEFEECKRRRERDRERMEQAEAENRRLTWCANELMRHGRDYARKRAGYADYWSLIWQDVLDAYAVLAEKDAPDA